MNDIAEGHRKKKLGNASSTSSSAVSTRGGGAYHAAEESESRLRSSRAECEQLRMKVKSTRDECTRLQSQVMELSEVRDLCRRLDAEVALLRSKTQSNTDEMTQRLRQLEEENKTMKDHVSVLESQVYDNSPSNSIGVRVSALERENELLCRESSDVRDEYRRFVDEIGGQIVQSLLVQKSLRDDYLHMRKRLQNVEQQNKYLSELLQKTMSTNSSLQTTSPEIEPLTSPVRNSDSCPAVPRCNRPSDDVVLPTSWSFSEDRSEAASSSGPQMVTNGCYYKLEFSQPLSSPCSRPGESPVVTEVASSPGPHLGRSHVIMGSKTLPLLHQQQRNARQPSARRNCPPPSRSFSKDDGYSSMTCDPSSPISSRRELSTLGECAPQLEDDSTVSDNTTIICAHPMETSTGTAQSGDDLEFQDTEPAPDGHSDAAGKRLAPSLDLETFAVLRRTTAAAKRMTELCRRSGTRLKRSSSDSALLPFNERLDESETSASGTATSSSSAGNGQGAGETEMSLELSFIDSGVRRRDSVKMGITNSVAPKPEPDKDPSPEALTQECLFISPESPRSTAPVSSPQQSQPPRAISSTQSVLHNPSTRPIVSSAPPPVLIQRRRFNSRSTRPPPSPGSRKPSSSSSDDSEHSPNHVAHGRRRSWKRNSRPPPPIPPRTCSTPSSFSKSPRVNLVHQTSLDEVRKRKKRPPPPKIQPELDEDEEDLNPVVDLLSPSDFRLAPEGGELGAEAAPNCGEGHEEFLRLCQRTADEADERQIREKIGQLSATVNELQRHLIQLGCHGSVLQAPPVARHLLSTPPTERRGRRSRSSSASGNANSDRDDLYIDDDLNEQPEILLGNEDRDSLLLELEKFQLPESSVSQD